MKSKKVRTIFLPGISVLLGVIVALSAFLFARENILEVESKDILYMKKGGVNPGTIRVSSGPVTELSFFTEVKFTLKRKDRDRFIIYVDRTSQVLFGVLPNGYPYLHWGSRKILPSRKSRPNPADIPKLLRYKWNHIGFIYNKGKLTAYVNGRKCWITSVTHKTMTPTTIELLPGESKTRVVYPVLAARALTSQHIRDLGRVSWFYLHLPLKILLLFLFSTLTSIFFLTYLLPIVVPRDKSSFTGTSVTGFARKSVLFTFSVNFVFFVLLDLGRSAARHLNRSFHDHGAWHASTYFTFLTILAMAFLFFFILGKIAAVSSKMRFFYVSGLLSLFLFTVVLSILPRFKDIYPIIFNGLFSLLFSFIIAAPCMLAMHDASYRVKTKQKG